MSQHNGFVFNGLNEFNSVLVECCSGPFRYRFIHSGYLYSAPSKNLLRGALSPATGPRPKRNILRSLQKKDALFRGSKRNERGSSFRTLHYTGQLHSGNPLFNDKFIHSFIHSGDLYSASSRDYYSEALPAQPRTK